MNTIQSFCLPYPQLHLEENGVPVGGPRFRVTHTKP